MKRLTLSPLLVAVCLASPAVADKAQNAADCAAFNWANWDYEVAHFDEADRSRGWKDQARAFESVAIMEGLGEKALEAHLASTRGDMKNMLEDYVFNGTAAAEKRFNTISSTCTALINSLPALSEFR